MSAIGQSDDPLSVSHVVGITANSKGKAAADSRIFRGRVRVLQRAARKDGLLRLIKRYGAKLFPIADERVFCDDVVDRNLALYTLSVSTACDVRHRRLTSRSCSIGTCISSAISLLPRKISPVLLQQHAGIAMLAKTRSYSMRLRSNHISTLTS